MAQSKIYDNKLNPVPHTNVISVETDEFGIVQRQWDWNLRGNGGLRNPQSDLVGKHVSDLSGFEIRPTYSEIE